MTNDRELRRQNGIVGGVCGGLGAFFGISPWWFRLVFLVLMMPGGLPGVLPYLILWIVIPKASPERAPIERMDATWDPRTRTHV